MSFKIELGKRYVTRDGKYYTYAIVTSTANSQFPYAATLYKKETGNRHLHFTYTESGSHDGRTESSCDLVAEYIPEKPLELEIGKTYRSRDGKLTTKIISESSNKDNYDFISDSHYHFQKNGSFHSKKVGSFSYPLDLVEEVVSGESQKILTLPLVVGKKYVAKDGQIVTVTETKYETTRGMTRLCKYNTDTWYVQESSGKFDRADLDCENDYDLISDYIEEPKQIEHTPEPPKPTKYKNLKFLEAWSLAKETGKRYRCKGHKWLVFPQVVITKELFKKQEWEVEK